MAAVAVREQRVVEIDGEITRVCRRTVEREVKTSDFSRELAGLVPVDSGILPAQCAHFIRANVEGRPAAVYTLERPAMMMPVKYNRHYDDAGVPLQVRTMHDYVLAWPATLWLFHIVSDNISALYMTVIKDPLSKHMYRTPLFVLPMVNLHESGNGHTCLGQTIKLDVAMPLHQRIETVVEYMRTSTWNDELRPNWQAVGWQAAGMKTWHDNSAIDPQYASKIPYVVHRRATYGKIITHLLKLPEEQE